MDIEKQREAIRLWNQLRKVEGPVAEELRIQILECFAERGNAKRPRSSAGASTAIANTRPRAASSHRLAS